MCIRILLLSLLQCSYQFGKTWSQDFPTMGYFMGSKDGPGDTGRRRQESLRLKPPPPDWPSPTMGAADFLYDIPEMTSLSPLQAYQAKLQEEYLKDLQEQSKKKPIQQQQKVTAAPASEWSSSEEEFKKLLDPNELLKLNKKLAPILSKQNKIASQLKKGLIDRTEKSPNIEPTVKPKRRRRTTSIPVHRLEDDEKAKYTDDKMSLEQRRTGVKKLRKRPTSRKIGEEKIKTKKRRVKAKKFAFDVHRSGSDSQMSSKTGESKRFGKPRGGVLKASSESSSEESEETSESSEEESTVTIRSSITEGTTDVSQGAPKTNITKTTSIPTLTISSTSTTDKIFIKSTTFTLDKVRITEKIKTESTISVRRMEVREKRKQIKQEMEKVLKEEELESFGDNDSEWTTSETPKFPIINVTPHEALMGILKHKIVNFVDNVLKSTSKQRRD